MKEPSEKKVCFAKDIFAISGVALPEEFSAKAYWKYIHDNPELIGGEQSGDTGQED